MNSKFQYVQQFEQEWKLLQNTYLIIRIDGKGFSKFTKNHNFEKPNDTQGLEAMNQAAAYCMQEFDIKLAYGQSDEYSFMFEPSSNPYQRRSQKLVSLLSSAFTSKYSLSGIWKYPPVFDARVVMYPLKTQMQDYFRWRQVDCHINNLYNTCFWNLVKSGIPNKQASSLLTGTTASDKNEILFSKFNINYNNEPEAFKKGTVLLYSKTLPVLNNCHLLTKNIYKYNGDLIKDSFWNTMDIE